MSAKLSWGKKFEDGEMIHISKADKGLKCGCVCAKCGTRSIARQGEENDHHFAHEGAMHCAWALETALHLLAKQIVHSGTYIKLKKDSVFYYTLAQKEKTLQNMVADVWLSNDSEELLVEIYVTHEVTPRKEQLILANNYKALEIDISHVDRNITETELKEILIEQLPNKRIIQRKVQAIEKEEDNFILKFFLAGGLAFIFWKLYRWFTSHRKKRRYSWR